MPNVQASVDSFIDEIKVIESSFDKDLQRLAVTFKNATETEVINATRQLNFLQELQAKGLGTALDNFDAEYTKMLQIAIKEAKKRGLPAFTGASIEGLEVLRDINYERLLGSFKEYSEATKFSLFRGVYANESISSITSGLAQTGMVTRQLNLVAYDGLKIFDDMSRYKVFQGQDVKWTYVGPQDAFTRPECQATKDNEPKGGYTESEASSSDTPFGIRGGFNCRHSWEIK
tara:strand:+ start:19050 stop:19742 length:693 start_codon:yes stop_codon:yes gene_type:complete